MIIVKEKSMRVKEADDQKLQKIAYDFFKYLTLRNLPHGTTIPEYDETVRKSHAVQYKDGVKEFVEALANYTSGYARSMQKDEQKYKSDYSSNVYTKISNALSYVIKSM
jgi:hypothetical protein